VLFSAEDATRSDLSFLVEAYKTAIEAGADEINVPDTVGVMTPSRMAYLIRYLRERLPPVPIHVHCHDDFGMAVANTITAVENGADVVQVVVNNFGERAGNAALEEVVAALHFLLGMRTNVRLEKLYELSQLVSKLFGVPNTAQQGCGRRKRVQPRGWDPRPRGSEQSVYLRAHEAGGRGEQEEDRVG
jgi:2-isopropylmalate synthase